MKHVFKSVFLVAICLVNSPSVFANTNQELKRGCIQHSAIYAVPACEQLIDFGAADQETFLRLSKLYQEQGELAKAADTLQQAISLFSEQGDQKSIAKTAAVKSEVDEELWLQNQNREVDEFSEARLTCINFSSVLPDRAIVACDQYLQYFPGESEVVEHRNIALEKTGLALNRSAAPTTTSPTPPTVVNNTNSAEYEAISEMRKELEGLYALLEKRNNTPSVTNSSVKYSELGKRKALIIGNAGYSKDIGRLKNSVNDAKDIDKKLRGLGFETTLLTDATLEEMEKSVFSIASSLSEEDTFLFYYAGHGVAFNGENYLIPINSKIAESVDVKYRALNLSFLMDKLNRGSIGTTIVVLDACRNNPFPVSRSTSSAGLVQTSGPSGTLVAYSTAPQQVALDGSGRNGIYTKHLLSEIGKPNLSIEEMFKKVRAAVENETHGEQIPWENSSLKSSFYFNHEQSI